MREKVLIAARIRELKQAISSVFLDAQLLAPYLTPEEVEELTRGVKSVEKALRQEPA